MLLGIFGLPQSGKTTLFNALTRASQPTGMVTGRIEVNTATVDVPDPRLDHLFEIFSPPKKVNAKVTYVDIAGLDGSAGKTGISGQLLNHLAQVDGFIHVVRCFEDESVPHQAGSVDPQRDILTMDGEFILNDLIMVERRLERLEDERRKGGGRDKLVIEREIALFNRLHGTLSDEIPLRDVEIKPDELKMLSSFGLLSNKPVLVTLNLGEGQETPQIHYEHQKSMLLAIQALLEMEIAQLPPEDMGIFLDEYGIEELGLDRIIRTSYDLLGLQTFFTYGEKEVRAWAVRRGATAPEAAGVVHSDMQRGFIRAEVIPYDDLSVLGGIAEARSQGKLRLDGKGYIVQDGDIITVRFNV
ncbi:MAG: redox-regulated ATPase YchF [Anaerolineaceae bacterium]|nr:redox-regulated ATPase YchF [Anaerolineaceae bacterium]